MKNKRGIIALFIAVVFGLLAAQLVANYVKRAEMDRPAPPPLRKAESPTPAPQTPLYGRMIPEGMRAVSIPVDEVTGVSHGVRRGDRVDVLAISNLPAGTAAGFPVRCSGPWKCSPPRCKRMPTIHTGPPVQPSTPGNGS